MPYAQSPFCGIQEGKIYVTRSGDRVGPMRPIQSRADGGYYWIDQNGRLYTHAGRVNVIPVAATGDIDRECLDPTRPVSRMPPPLKPPSVERYTPPPPPAKTITSCVAGLYAKQALESAAQRMLKARLLIDKGSSDEATRELLAATENINRAAQLARYI